MDEITLPVAVQSEAASAIRLSSGIKSVEDREDLESVAAIRRTLKLRIDAIVAAVEPMRKSADEAKKRILEFRSMACKSLEDEDRRLGSLASKFLMEDERRRRAEEAQRLADLEKAERARREKDAKKLEKAGKAEDADRLREAPVVVAPTIQEAPVVAGAPVRTIWKFRVVDATIIPGAWLIPDEKLIGDFVRRTGQSAMRVIPGIEVYAEVSQTIRR